MPESSVNSNCFVSWSWKMALFPLQALPNWVFLYRVSAKFLKSTSRIKILVHLLSQRRKGTVRFPLKFNSKFIQIVTVLLVGWEDRHDGCIWIPRLGLCCGLLPYHPPPPPSQTREFLTVFALGKRARVLCSKFKNFKCYMMWRWRYFSCSQCGGITACPAPDSLFLERFVHRPRYTLNLTDFLFSYRD